jgi:dipeptidyl aminopeptidase/acylaminoacyl peptidase
MIPGFLYMPSAKFTGKRPVLIDLHGGYAQYRPAFRDTDDYFTSELGIAMIYPNIRGTAGYGKTYLKLDNGLLRDNSYNDIGSLLDWIKMRRDLDPERVMLRGVSAGGNVALAAAARLGERVRGAIAISAPSNLVTFIEKADPWMQDRFREEYGDERDPEMRQYLQGIAPRNNVNKMRGPLLIIHGKRDTRVAASEGEQMIAAAKNGGLSVWSVLAKDEGHGFADPRIREFIFLSEIAFIQRYVLGM